MLLPGEKQDGRFRGRSRAPRVLTIRTAWTSVGDGECFCPTCGGDRSYQRLTGRHRLALLGVPLLPRGESGPVVECASCRNHFGAEILDHPTTNRFSAMLKDAAHTVVLAVLTAGGTSSRTTLDTAVGVLRSSGFQECARDQLASLVEALDEDCGRATGRPPCGAGLAIELHEALSPLTPHLAAPGRESLLLRGARIALADGPYTPDERDVLATTGMALGMDAEDVERLLASAAGMPF